MEHPNATHVRSVFTAIAAGDIVPAYDAVHEDIHNVNDIGAGPWRETRGREAFFDFFAQFGALFDGTFRQDVLEVIGYDDRVVVVVHETGTAQGNRFDNRAIYLIEIVDGRWTALRTMDMDHDDIERFWAAVVVPDAAAAAR